MALKVETENTISSGVDEENRRVFFGRYLPSVETEDGNDFSEISVEYAIRGIHLLISQNQKKPIEIHMNSYGGNPNAMLYLHDLILASPVQFKFFGGGAIQSAATWIMAVCDERYLYRNTKVMVHNGSVAMDWTKVTDAEIKIEEEKSLQSDLEDIYTNNSRMPKAFWTEVCKRDLYLSAEETVALGLADAIIPNKKRGAFRKVRQAALEMNPHHNTMKKIISRLRERIQLSKTLEITFNAPVPEEVDEQINIVENVIIEPPKE